jgi:pre-mRNA-processing factor 40
MSDSPSKAAGEWVSHALTLAILLPLTQILCPAQQEYKAPDGRTYWSHSVTKQSRWDKPDDLKTPFEVSGSVILCKRVETNALRSQRAMAKTQWKQYMSKDRPYYVNTATRETVVSIDHCLCFPVYRLTARLHSGSCRKTSKT